MLLSHVELAAFDLSDAWGASPDVRKEAGEVILPPELERLLEALHSNVKAKKLELSELQKKRIERAKGNGSKLGRKVIDLPIEEIRKRALRGEDIRDLAKEFKVDRMTISNRLRK